MLGAGSPRRRPASRPRRAAWICAAAPKPPIPYWPSPRSCCGPAPPPPKPPRKPRRHRFPDPGRRDQLLERRRRLGRRHDRHASQPDTAEGNLHPGPRDQPVRADGRALGVAGRGRPSTRRRRRVHTRAQRADRRTDRRRAARATDHTTRTDQHPVRAACKVTPPWSALLTGSPVDGCRSPPSKPATSPRASSSCLTELPPRAWRSPRSPTQSVALRPRRLSSACRPARQCRSPPVPAPPPRLSTPSPGRTYPGRRRWQRTCEALDSRLLGTGRCPRSSGTRRRRRHHDTERDSQPGPLPTSTPSGRCTSDWCRCPAPPQHPTQAY